MDRITATETIAAHLRGSDLVVSTTGMISRELFATHDREGNFYMIGSMGLASAFALGLALMNPERRVVILEGDGSSLMSLGTLPLIASQAPANLVHIVLDNEAYESTGGQPSISNSVSIADIAEAAGYQRTRTTPTTDELAAALVEADNLGPIFILAKVSIAPVPGIPRVSHSPEEIRNRFRESVRSSS